MGLMPFAEAYERALARVSPVAGVEDVAISAALGRVLAQSVIAPVNVPNHDNTAMDGYGVRYGDLSQDCDTVLDVVGVVQAGARMQGVLGAGEAVRIFTGAPIPDGCDCIVIQENVTRDGDALTVPAGQKQAQHIRRTGQDIAEESEVFATGRMLTPPDIGMLASLGRREVTVLRRLKVAVVSTGDEVIEPGEAVQPGQLYDSNRHSMMAALRALGVEVIDLGIARDDRAAITAALLRGADEADVVLTSGGVSVGDYDLVKEVIRDVGEIDFWKVRMKPGKPQAHGRIGDAVFFGLPGNPVSVLATFLLLVRPALLVMMGCAPAPLKQLQMPYRGDPIVKKHDRAEFARAKIEFDGTKAAVTSTGAQGSGILTSMSKADAFIMLSEVPCEVRTGDMVTVILIEY